MHPFSHPDHFDSQSRQHLLRHFRAVIFDMDGVVTDTAGVHQRAWKDLFDSVLTELGGPEQAPFTESDYLNFVDGRPREDGVRSFLASRGITVPEGSDEDAPDATTVAALAARKQEFFSKALERDGVHVFDSTVALARELVDDAVPTAIVTSSRNGRDVLRAAGVIDLFDVIVDGTDALRLGLPGKPDPEMFLEAARQLGCDPEDGIVVEDAAFGVRAARSGGFGLVIGLDRAEDPQRLKDAGANIVASDLAGLDLRQRTTRPFDPNWVLTFDDFDPATEGTREALCTMGNGYWGTRGSVPGASAGAVHYPGTYLAGVFNRLETPLQGKVVETESMVNAPDWTYLAVKPDSGQPFLPTSPELIDYRQEFDLRRGLLTRVARYKDPYGRITSVRTRQFQSMAGQSLAAIEMTVIAENWSGAVTIRSMIDGRVANRNVAADRELAGAHFEPVISQEIDGETVLLETVTSQSRIHVATVARTTVHAKYGEDPVRTPVLHGELVAGSDISVELEEGVPVRVEKIAGVSTSRDNGMSTPRENALNRVSRADGFRRMLNFHEEMWGFLWSRFAVRLEGSKERNQLAVNLHSFHVIQTCFGSRFDLDAGVPARGLHGEGYRGHLFWDEMFIYPMLTLRNPELTRGLLMYRYRRLSEARALAREYGYEGAMYPWQSGSSGREETPEELYNPRSEMWMPDNSHRQRHVSLAIAFSVLRYYEITGDLGFLSDFGGEICVEVCRLFASMATYDAERDRFDIDGVMGPDEYHDGYPDRPGEGLKNNAYTNVLASWVLSKTVDVVRELDGRNDPLSDWLDVFVDELDHWDHVSRRLRVTFQRGGIMNQFEGYEKLLEFDWDGYREKYGNIGRLDLILQAEGDATNRYKLSKQADVLMLSYLFSAEELLEHLGKMGYRYNADDYAATVDYYLQRTSHGSTLSRLVYSWVAARTDRAASWELFQEVLEADLSDTQGGTTKEGVHLGAMAGTVDLVIRCYGGVETREDALWLHPKLPAELPGVRFKIRYRNQPVTVKIDQEEVQLRLLPGSVQPITVNVEGEEKILNPGEKWTKTLNNGA